MIARITSCGITAGRGAGFQSWDRRQGERRQAPERRRPAAAEQRQPEPPRATASPRSTAIPGCGDAFRTEVQMAVPTRATEAARAFSAGNCFLSGTLIDRCI